MPGFEHIQSPTDDFNLLRKTSRSFPASVPSLFRKLSHRLLYVPQYLGRSCLLSGRGWMGSCLFLLNLWSLVPHLHICSKSVSWTGAVHQRVIICFGVRVIHSSIHSRDICWSQVLGIVLDARNTTVVLALPAYTLIIIIIITLPHYLSQMSIVWTSVS